MADVTELVALKVTKVGLVDNGANGRVFAIVKRALPFADLPIVVDEPPEETDAELIDGLLGEDGDDWDAMDDAHLWRDDDAIEARDGERAREDYKLPIARRDDDGTVRAYWPKVSGALAALNGARGGVDIPADDIERAFTIGVQYVSKLNDALPEDEAKPIPEFTGAGMADEVDKLKDEVDKLEHADDEVIEPPETDTADTETTTEFPALQAVAAERLKMAENMIGDLKNFADMTKEEVSDKLWALSDTIWGAHTDLVSLAKSVDVKIRKRNQEGQMAEQTEKSAEVVALEKSHGDELKKRDTDLAKRDDRITALEKSVEAANDKSRLGELVTKARDDFPSLGDPETIAKSLQTIEKKAGTEAFDAQVQVLKGAEAKAKAGGLDRLTKSNGRAEQVDEDSAEGKVHNLAKKLLDDGKADNFDDAVSKVLAKNPNLYKQHKAEQG